MGLNMRSISINKYADAMRRHVLVCLLITLFCASPVWAGFADFLPQDDSGFFAKDTRFWSVIGGRSEDDGELGRIILSEFTISKYLLDNFALTYGLGVDYVRAKKTQNGYQGGPKLGLRMHFINYQRVSIYIDGSIGLIYHQHPLEEGTLHFNFDAQAGFGATVRITETYALRGGYRHHHLSNAGIGGDDKNLGYDAAMFYFGLMRSF